MKHSEKTTRYKELEAEYRKFRKDPSNPQSWWDTLDTLHTEEEHEMSRQIVSASYDADVRLRKYKRSPLFVNKIRKYCNMHMYTDVHPFEVVKVVSDKCVEVRAMKAELVRAPKEFSPGGFVGHFADNHAQKYKYESDTESKPFRIRLSKRMGWQNKGQRFRMSDKPIKFHDYNF